MHSFIILGSIYLSAFSITMFLLRNFIRRDIKQSVQMDNFRVTGKIKRKKQYANTTKK